MAKPKPKPSSYALNGASGWTPERKRATAERLKVARDQKSGKIPAKPPENGEGWPGSSNSEARSRRRLTLATLEGMQRAFDRGGQKAIEKVMKTQPAIFLKMLVLLVPREMNIEHSGSVKEMTDQQIDDAIAAIKQMIADRERQAKMIDVTPSATPDGEAVSEP
jgi:hypothetical protein